MNIESAGSNAATDLSAASDDRRIFGAVGSEPSSRRAFLAGVVKVAALIVAAPLMASRVRAQGSARTPHMANAAGIAITVYKDPTCGCCNEWIKHMQKAGFTVTAENSTKMDAIKAKLGVPGVLASCHTAVVSDYIVEGHVPADLVQKMLKEKPNARGLAVPGMPMGSPGMEGPTKEQYNVMLFDRLGKATVYASR